MAWTAAQDAAFSAGAGQVASNVLVVIAGIVITFGVLWVSWVGISLFDRWRTGAIEYGELAWYLVRAVTILSVMTFLIR